jgi:integration host factor subunit beta
MIVMIRPELIKRILATNPRLLHRHVEAAVNLVLDEIQDALQQGQRVELRGFGVFAAKRRRQKESFTPRTRATMAIPEKLYPVFHPGKEMMQRLNDQSPALPGIS